MTQPKLATLALGVLIALGLFCSIPMVVADDSDSSSNDASKVVDPDLKRARELLGNDNYPKALTHLKKVLQRDPNNPDVHNLLGYSYRKLDQVDEAFTHYHEALRIKPGHLGGTSTSANSISSSASPKKPRNTSRCWTTSASSAVTSTTTSSRPSRTTGGATRNDLCVRGFSVNLVLRAIAQACYKSRTRTSTSSTSASAPPNFPMLWNSAARFRKPLSSSTTVETRTPAL